MATHYIENASSGSQYYFNNNTASSQSQRTYTPPIVSSLGPSGYTTFSTTFSGPQSSSQPIRLDDTYHSPQHFQSVAGFNRNVGQQSSSSPPHLRPTVRAVSSQEQYRLQRSPQPAQISPQQHHFQFDPHQQPGHSTGPAVVYQTPGAAQYTHHNVDLWTENPSRGQDHYVQAQRVSVRSVSTGSPQQSHSVSPQRPQDHLQQYYSQLTPEQHQQLLRQQQLQRQQEQHRVIAQQVSPSPTYHQEQYRSTSGFDAGQQGHGRGEAERQRQDEQDYRAAQQKMAAQRAQQLQQEEPSHPVGIRNLMNKFAGPAPAHGSHPRSKSTSSRQYSSSSYATNSGPRQQTTTTRTTTQSMTYSNLPKTREPPVNSAEYYQMLMLQGGNPFTNIQQAVAPTHIQHASMDIGGGRDRFGTGSLSEDFYRPQVMHQQQQPRQQQQQQQQSNAGGGGGGARNTLSSLRNQYIDRANESIQPALPSQEVQNISRTIIGEDTPQQKQQKQASAAQATQQQSAPAPQASQQGQAPSSENASPPKNDTTTAEAPAPSK